MNTFSKSHIENNLVCFRFSGNPSITCVGVSITMSPFNLAHDLLSYPLLETFPLTIICKVFTQYAYHIIN